ncbi:hypothetical protein [Halobacillus sp. Marseille-Q1614]|uniref:hypothetical protein n=1 Tax=Halobacillus sp. Marseille-Q1614 TaxID=2709134 RepID=UPI00156D7AF4|nr:hypothetical protein [Halobacillus sp. Marseille-Q1614]
MEINIMYREHEGRHGADYRALTAKDASGNTLTNDTSGMTVVEFIEKVVSKVIQRNVSKGHTANDITVNLPAEVTLSSTLQTHLVAKFTADPLVNSVTFA